MTVRSQPASTIPTSALGGDKPFTNTLSTWLGKRTRVGKMAQRRNAFAVLAEDPDLTPSTWCLTTICSSVPGELI